MEEKVKACVKCGDTHEPDPFLDTEYPIVLDDDGLCFRCWRETHGIFPDLRGVLQRYLDGLAGGEEDGDTSN